MQPTGENFVQLQTYTTSSISHCIAHSMRTSNKQQHELNIELEEGLGEIMNRSQTPALNSNSLDNEQPLSIALKSHNGRPGRASPASSKKVPTGAYGGTSNTGAEQLVQTQKTAYRQPSTNQ